MAHEAVTASRTDVAASRPNTTRAPSSRFTAVIQVGCVGQLPNRSPSQLTPASTARVPSGSRAAATTPGRYLHGRRRIDGTSAGSSGAARPAPGPIGLAKRPEASEDVRARRGERRSGHPGDEVRRWEAGAQQGCGRGPGRGPDDHLGRPRVPSGEFVQGGERPRRGRQCRSGHRRRGQVRSAGRARDQARSCRTSRSFSRRPVTTSARRYTREPNHASSTRRADAPAACSAPAARPGRSRTPIGWAWPSAR